MNDLEGRYVGRHLLPGHLRRLSRKLTKGDRQQKVRRSEFYDTRYLLRRVPCRTYYCTHILECGNDYINTPYPECPGCPAERITAASPRHYQSRLFRLFHHPSCPLSSVARRALNKLQHLPKRNLRRKRAVGSDQPVRRYSSCLLSTLHDGFS